ncbi:MAG: acetyl-CoA carboxylase carboxyltransferase subunit alpha, partial [Syntrophomonadaceae bacterium]|nr:acetyl-CoA carboxylase carboxyltransferase subunit alpha [Syntrophomonadaceae bacterium]MDD4548364.1 acetyl-CoA carboxylase carboxyltransferase subunit alpha [Syntrophomonadaceae bacterium]
MVKRQFDYEQKYQELLTKVKEIKETASTMNFNLEQEFEVVEKKMESIREEKYRHLTPWERILLTRHPERPTTRDYIEFLCEEWIEVHGDRYFGDDAAIIGGIGLFEGCPVTIIGHQKGKNTPDNLKHNFGMPHPEGYRKVERLILQAEKFKRPVITFIDTPGAYPGVGAEERGQAGAISQVLMTMAGLKVPIIAVVTGEGGSGGALALAVADRLLMLSNAVFSVASAEACASIIWKDVERVEEMAAILKITAEDLLELGIIDEILPEPIGGAHQDFQQMAETIK